MKPTPSVEEVFTPPTDDAVYGPVLIGGELPDGNTWNLRYSTRADGARVCLEAHPGGFDGEMPCYSLWLGATVNKCGHPGQWAVGFGGMWEPLKGVLWGSVFPDVERVRVELRDGSEVPAHFGYAAENAGLRVFTAVVTEANPPVRVLGEGTDRQFDATLRPSRNEITRAQIFDDPTAGGGLAYSNPFGNCGG